MKKNLGYYNLEYCQAERWLDLWHWFGVSADAKIMEAYQELIEKYAEPHRKYHNLYHINICLAELETVKRFATNANALEIAIWYHDAIYDVWANDNEEKSAELAEKVIIDLGLSRALAQRVKGIILATKHNSVPDHYDAKLMLDIDIANFGKAEMFKITNQLVREEYSAVAEKEFMEGRSNILAKFLNRPRIYLTNFFYNKYEDAAKKNIAGSIINS